MGGGLYTQAHGTNLGNAQLSEHAYTHFLTRVRNKQQPQSKYESSSMVHSRILPEYTGCCITHVDVGKGRQCTQQLRKPTYESLKCG